jgi:serine/threonine protein kinase
VIELCPYDDDIWKFKKRLLKRLKYRNYKDREL